MIKILFATINSYLGYPPVKQLYSYLKDDHAIYCIQNNIKEYENFFEVPLGNQKIIHTYDSSDAFNSQSLIHKLNKYIKLSFYYLSNRLKWGNKKVTAFTIDLFTLFLCLITKNKKQKVVYLQYEMIELNQLNYLDKKLFKFIKKRSNKIDLIITPELNRTKYLKKLWPKANDDLFFTLPNTNNNSPILEAPPLNREKIKITHIGAVGLSHNIAHFMEAISQLDGNRYEVRFIGRLTTDVKELIKNYNCAHVKMIGQIKHSELKKYYLDTDIGVILYKDLSINHRFCAPNKLYEYWSYGIPVLGDTLPGLISVFKDKSLGQLVDMNKTKNIVEAIKSLNDYQNKKYYIQNYFAKNYKLDNYLNALEKKLNEK